MRSHDSEAGATRAPGHSEKGRLHWRKKQGGPAEQPEGERAGVLWSRNAVARTTGGSGEAEKPVSARNTRAGSSAGDDGIQGGDEGDEGVKAAQASDRYNGVGRSSGNRTYESGTQMGGRGGS